MKSKRDVLSDLHSHGVDVDNRTVCLLGEIDEEVSAQFIKNIFHLQMLKDDPIHVVLNTRGGDITEGLAIYDTLRIHGSVDINARGSVMSMGVAILQGGNYRVASRNTRFMVHQGSTVVPEVNTNDLKAETAETIMLAKIYENILLTRIRQKNPKFPVKRLREMLDKTTYFSAEEAYSLGLIDEVVG